MEGQAERALHSTSLQRRAACPIPALSAQAAGRRAKRRTKRSRASAQNHSAKRGGHTGQKQGAALIQARPRKQLAEAEPEQ